MKNIKYIKYIDLFRKTAVALTLVSLIFNTGYVSGMATGADAQASDESESSINIDNSETSDASECRDDETDESFKEISQGNEDSKITGSTDNKSEDNDESGDSTDSLEQFEEDFAEEIVIEYQTIEIGSVNDLIELAENCSIDSWSLDKNVKLTADIDIRNTGFVTIPYFNGIFDGNSHTIKGYTSSDDGYLSGFFRYIGPNGLVENLNVTTDIQMSDDQKYTGGICGMNRGVIRSCNLLGDINGNNTVGAIAAINENTGLISNCTNEAYVSGYYFTGGIAGKNYGTISGCTNKGNMNDSEEWVVIDDEKGNDLLESITSQISDDLSQSQIESGTDTGGIAGYSKGSIIRCTNYGNIGYEHVGYNIGGIAGRQMGIISCSTNYGNVYGRKDIGGIAGQMEPDLEPEDIQELPEAADTLHDLVSQLIDDMDNSSDTISSDITTLTGYADGVADDGRALAGEFTVSINENVNVINAAIERFEYVMDNLPGVIDSAQSGSSALYYFNQSLARMIEDITVNDDLSDADRTTINNAEEDIYQKYSNSSSTAKRVQELTDLINALMYETDSEGNTTLRILTDEEQNQLNAYFAELQKISSQAGSDISSMMSDVSNLYETYKPYTEASSDAVSNEVDNAVSALSDAQKYFDDAMTRTRSIIDYLNSQEDLRVVGLSSAWDESLDSIHNNLHGITDSIQSINVDGNNASHTIDNDLEAINDQINVIYHIISDRLDIIVNDDAEVFTDVSDEELESAKTGRIDSSYNAGNIYGDINIGGIAGSMAIDDEDPEENAAGNISIGNGSKYTLKNIICNCKNNSTVQSKKDGAGLIAGYMAHGIVTGCEGYGLVKSTEGSYVGGIAGESLSIIRDCYSLCILDGSKYVGGITGYGTTISGCKVLSTWNGEPKERYGSIAGLVNTDDETQRLILTNVKNNYFVEGEVGGIDDISYAGIAEPETYNEMTSEYGTPSEFEHLKVIFFIDGEKVGEDELSYGESLSNIAFPEVEYKEGYYISWSDVSDEIMKGDFFVEGEYLATKKAVESTEEYEDTGKHLVLLGGSYGDDASVEAQIVDEPSYEISNRYTEHGATVYKVSIDEGSVSQDADKKIRLYSPYNNAIVKKYTDDGWTQISARQIGSYMEIALDEDEAILAVIDYNTLPLTIIRVLGILIVACVIIFVLLRFIKRGRKIKEKINSHKK